MDFFLRLIGGGGNTTASAKAQPGRTPVERLAKFKREYSQALRVWNQASITKANASTVAEIERTLHLLTTLLHEDTRAPAPHLCAHYVATTAIYKAVSRVALSVNHRAITREAVKFFAILVDCDADILVGTDKFAEAVTKLVDRLLYASEFSLDETTEAEVLEFMFNIAATLRLQPAMLQVWLRSDAETKYTPTSGQPTNEGETLFEAPSERNDFPLCRQFVGRIHYERRTGDFARMGLLYLFETATRAPLLEDWICGSDLSVLMASGLGALYSQLSRYVDFICCTTFKSHMAGIQNLHWKEFACNNPERLLVQCLKVFVFEDFVLLPEGRNDHADLYRKVTISWPGEDLPLLLAFSEAKDPTSSPEVETMHSHKFRSELSQFVNYLDFWQDALEHCRSERIITTLQESFQLRFLHQILHPSMIQSFSTDNDSLVATMTYYWRILETLRKGLLAELVIHDLLGLDSDNELDPSAISRSSASDANAVVYMKKALSDPLNLEELILESLRSPNAELITVSLRILTVLMSQHHGYAISVMTNRSVARDKKPPRQLRVLISELDGLISLSRSVLDTNDTDTAYENCLNDALSMIESHDCSDSALDFGGDQVFDHSAPNHNLYEIDREDPLFKLLFSLLETFLINDIGVNAELTCLFAHLASCPHVQLEGWLAAETTQFHGSQPNNRNVAWSPQGQNQGVDDLDHEEKARIETLKQSLRASTVVEHDEPLLVKVFRTLLTQLEGAKVQVPELEDLVASRRRAFLAEAEMENDLSEVTRVPPGIRQGFETTIPRTTSNNLPKMVGVMAEPVTPQRSRAANRPQDEIMTPISSPKQANSPLWSWFTGSPAPKPRIHRPEVIRSPAATVQMQSHEFVAKLSDVDSPTTDKAVDMFSKMIALGHSEVSQPCHEARLGDLLTNAMILQEFILEMAALMQVRAGLLKNEFSIA